MAVARVWRGNSLIFSCYLDIQNQRRLVLVDLSLFKCLRLYFKENFFFIQKKCPIYLLMGVSWNKLLLMVDCFKNILQCKQQILGQSINYHMLKTLNCGKSNKMSNIITFGSICNVLVEIKCCYLCKKLIMITLTNIDLVFILKVGPTHKMVLQKSLHWSKFFSFL